MPVRAETGGMAPAPAGMAATERHRRLLALVREAGRIEVAAGAEALSVSVETVRRDLNVLQRHGLVRREYGVAFPVDSRGFESDLTQRQTEHLAEKRRIATEAARHLEDAETVFVDEGFLPQMVAQELPAHRELTVVTASLPVAVVLAARPSTTVIMVGGRMRAKTLAAVDHWATAMLAQFVIDVAFLGANGISRADGLTTPDPQVADVKAAAVRASRRRIFVGAHVKFGVATFCRFAEVKELDTVITDTGLPGAEAQRYQLLGPTVIRV